MIRALLPPLRGSRGIQARGSQKQDNDNISLRFSGSPTDAGTRRRRFVLIGQRQ